MGPFNKNRYEGKLGIGKNGIGSIGFGMKATREALRKTLEISS